MDHIHWSVLFISGTDRLLVKKNEHGPTKKARTIYIGPCFLFQGWTDYLVKKKNEHGPTKKAWTIYIGPCFLSQGRTDKRKKAYKRQKS